MTLGANSVAVSGYNRLTKTYYGCSPVNGHYQTSVDGVTWTDRTYSPSVYTPKLIEWEFDSAYMYGYSSDGRIWRAATNVFNKWVEISVPSRGALTSGRPGSLCALGSGILLYGNYTSGVGDGAHIWRSTDAGTTWTEVLGIPAGKHVHCIRRSPTTGLAWATLGDAGFEGTGLWRSSDSGASWTHMSGNDYGIDMVFAPASGTRPAMLVMEGDGLNRPHLLGFYEDDAPGDDTFPLVWFSGAPSDPLSTRGTVRGIAMTPMGDVVFFTTTERGTVGTRSGLWVAQAPDYTTAILLKETTGSEPATYQRTYLAGSLLMNNQCTFPMPVFAG